MKRILFTLLLAVVLWGGIVVESALAADRNYKIENCDRKKLWEGFSIELQIEKPELIEFLDKYVKPTKEAPKLNESDYKDIEQFDQKFQWNVSECILFFKEANQLINSVYELDNKQATNISWVFTYLFSRMDIPYVDFYNRTTDKWSFTFNFAPLRQGKTY